MKSSLSELDPSPIEQIPRCFCHRPVYVQQIYTLPGWALQHRGWNTLISYPRLDDNVGSAKREMLDWLQREHHKAALRLCDEIFELWEKGTPLV